MPPPTPPAPAGEPPGGLSAANFKAVCANAGQWLWGTVQGAFNEKASLSQIVVDAVIGMIPLVGDATAVRDLIAVTIGMVDQPEKRKKVWEWVLLVVLLFALIPVIGGVIKGVGRVVTKLAKEAAVLAGAVRAAHMAEGAKSIIEFLNRIGHRNAEAWFKALSIGEHQAQLLERFNGLLETINGALIQIQRKLHAVLPTGLLDRIEGLKNGLASLKELGQSMIPQAVKELDQHLREIQALVHSGGNTTSRVVAHEVATTERGVTKIEEARLIEGGALPARTGKGWPKNDALAKEPESYQNVYTHESGYIDLRVAVKEGHCFMIEAFSGKIVNRELKPGEQIYRYFGEGGLTHNVSVADSAPGGTWWGLGTPPKSAKEWRENSAVLDEWNRDGYVIVGTVPPGSSVKAAVGKISAQGGKNLPGQFLAGGGSQAAIDVNKATKLAMEDVGKEVIATGKAQIWVDPVSHIRFEIRPTGWTDANGVHGYLEMPGQTVVHTEPLGAHEQAAKRGSQVSR